MHNAQTKNTQDKVADSEEPALVLDAGVELGAGSLGCLLQRLHLAL